MTDLRRSSPRRSDECASFRWLGRRIDPPVRKALVNRFPYLLHYACESDAIVGVYHAKRRPHLMARPLEIGDRQLVIRTRRSRQSVALERQMSRTTPPRRSRSERGSGNSTGSSTPEPKFRQIETVQEADDREPPGGWTLAMIIPASPRCSSTAVSPTPSAAVGEAAEVRLETPEALEASLRRMAASGNPAELPAIEQLLGDPKIALGGQRKCRSRWPSFREGQTARGVLEFHLRAGLVTHDPRGRRDPRARTHAWGAISGSVVRR